MICCVRKKEIATACLFIAGKVEETPKPLSELAHTLHTLQNRKHLSFTEDSVTQQVGNYNADSSRSDVLTYFKNFRIHKIVCAKEYCAQSEYFSIILVLISTLSIRTSTCFAL